MSIEKQSVSASVRCRGSRDRIPGVQRDRRAGRRSRPLRTGTHRKTLSFRTNDGVILIVAAGDTKIDNPKYKARFGCKARMLAFEEVEPEIGHAVGGVCPFGVNDGVTVYLDESLRRFETVFRRAARPIPPSKSPSQNWRNSPVSRHGWTSAKGWREREHGCHRAVRRRGGQNFNLREIERLAQTAAENGAKMLFCRNTACIMQK